MLLWSSESDAAINFFSVCISSSLAHPLSLSDGLIQPADSLQWKITQTLTHTQTADSVHPFHILAAPSWCCLLMLPTGASFLVRLSANISHERLKRATSKFTVVQWLCSTVTVYFLLQESLNINQSNRRARQIATHTFCAIYTGCCSSKWIILDFAPLPSTNRLLLFPNLFSLSLWIFSLNLLAIQSIVYNARCCSLSFFPRILTKPFYLNLSILYPFRSLYLPLQPHYHLPFVYSSA